MPKPKTSDPDLMPLVVWLGPRDTVTVHVDKDATYGQLVHRLRDKAAPFGNLGNGDTHSKLGEVPRDLWGALICNRIYDDSDDYVRFTMTRAVREQHQRFGFVFARLIYRL